MTHRDKVQFISCKWMTMLMLYGNDRALANELWPFC